MTGQAPKRKTIKDLMTAGEGFSGFPWPEDYRDFDIRIGADGTWYHQDGPITRLKLCQLFATVLQRDDAGVYWLVTPAERGRIEVEDAPFFVVEMQTDGADDQKKLMFRTSLDHWVTAGPENPIRVEENAETGEPSPYIMIRDGLEARISRPVYYDLVALAAERRDGAETIIEITSAGQTFELGRFESDPEE